MATAMSVQRLPGRSSGVERATASRAAKPLRFAAIPSRLEALAAPVAGRRRSLADILPTEPSRIELGRRYPEMQEIVNNKQAVINPETGKPWFWGALVRGSH